MSVSKKQWVLPDAELLLAGKAGEVQSVYSGRYSINEPDNIYHDPSNVWVL